MNPYLEKLQRGPQSSRFSRRARVELLPLIDVMFLLVAFFMAISISMVMQKGIFVDLSPAKTADSSLSEEYALVISLDAQGEFFLNKEKLSIAELEETLVHNGEKDKDRPVIINADKAVRHERVIQALDLVRNSGLHNVIFSVEPKE